MLKTATLIISLVSASAAMAEVKPMPEAGRFCPSWAEAHERTLASLNDGRAPYVVDETYGSNEIIYKGRHWFSDGGPF